MLGQWQGGESWAVAVLAVRGLVRVIGSRWRKKPALERVLGLASRLAGPPGAPRSHSKQLPADSFSNHLALWWRGREGVSCERKLGKKWKDLE